MAWSPTFQNEVIFKEWKWLSELFIFFFSFLAQKRFLLFNLCLKTLLKDISVSLDSF